MPSLTSAPAFTRVLTTSMWPSLTAKSRGVNPEDKVVRKFGAGLDKLLHDLGVAFGGGPHQRRLFRFRLKNQKSWGRPCEL